MPELDAATIEQHGGTPVSTKVLDQRDNSIHWKECNSCSRIKPYAQFHRDSSYREGYRNQCMDCESAPRLSTLEHTHLLRERNNNSWAVKNQKHPDQELMKNDESRRGRYMHHSDFLRKLRNISRGIFIKEGGIVGDLAVYKVWERYYEGEKNYEYVCYIPTGWMPEFSINEFNHQDVLVRESQRGWRTVLIRLIKANVITLEAVREEFGDAVGLPSALWHKNLQGLRQK